MSLLDALQTALLADATIVALATGGVYTVQPIPGLAETAPAFDEQTGRIRPTISLFDPSASAYPGPADARVTSIHLLHYALTVADARALEAATFAALQRPYIGGTRLRWLDRTGPISDVGYMPPELYIRSRYQAVGRH